MTVRPRIAFLTLAALSAATIALAVSQEAKTQDGRTVILDEKGTWSYKTVASSATAKTAAGTSLYADDAVDIWDKALTLERVEGKPGVVKLTLSYQNKMPTRIVGMAVLVDIANPLGKIVFTQTLDDETVILPGEKKKADSYWSFPDNAAVEGEPYDRLWQITKNGTATVTTKVKKVVLDDGTVIHAKRRSLFKNN